MNSEKNSISSNSGNRVLINNSINQESSIQTDNTQFEEPTNQATYSDEYLLNPLLIHNGINPTSAILHKEKDTISAEFDSPLTRSG